MTRDLARNRSVLHSSACNYANTGHLVTNPVNIPWKSKGNREEWLLIDLGAVSEISSVSIRWGEAFSRKFIIQLSDSGSDFIEAASGSGVKNGSSESVFHGSGRYVKLLLRECSGDCYEIFRVSVFGENDLVYALPKLPSPGENGTQLLTGGNWRVERASEISHGGETLSQAGYDDSGWLPAVVPGTVLNSYLEAGAIPDPFYDDDQFQVSEEFFTADFWYRNHFVIPDTAKGQHIFLNFEEINWKADIFFNGVFLKNAAPGRAHSIEGAFVRAKFDVTSFVHFGEENFLAVRILKNDTPGEVTTQGLAFGPGPNGGKLGADNPTCHAAVGWDWLPTIRGRNIGILGDVSVTASGGVLLMDPWMKTDLPLLKESTAIPTEDLMLRKGTSVSDQKAVCPGEAFEEWVGKDGDSFTADFGKPVPIGAVTLVWGTEAGGAAADFESRHPECFRLETSEDGVNWRPLDAYPGGKVPVRFFGLLDAPENPGTRLLPGHSISDTCPGATAIVALDLKRFGRGIENRPVVQPGEARFLRFTVEKQRELSGRAVDTIVRKIRVYAETPEEVEQATKHSYTLDTSRAELSFLAALKNLGGEEKSVRLCGKILPDGPEFSEDVAIPGNSTLDICLPLVLSEPKLWWPNTYGDQPLYTCEVRLEESGCISDRKTFDFGVRRFDTPIEGGLLTLYCNGVRIVAKGGNWGLDGGLKRDTREVLFNKVRLHAEANMTMIRNWVGMTNHPAFYDACDRYGILIWDDFWLANPVDGPEPDDPEMFLCNAADKIRRVRSHPSLVFYCGRNEGNPREDIHEGLLKLTAVLDGTRIYFPHSAAAPVGSGGGYQLARPGETGGVRQYYNDVTSSVLRSERGIPNVPEYESALKFVRPEHLWPISETWALHDWTYHMNGPANTYMEAVKNILGGEFTVPEDHVQGQAPKDSDPVFRQYKEDIAKMCEEAAKAWDVRDFFKASQLINYEHHRGMFEALSSRLSNGLLMWMSQSSWPSFMWQTYDYYLYTNGGYFGTKAGNQPTRAFFDPGKCRILAANASPKAYEKVLVSEDLFNLYGQPLDHKEHRISELPADAYGLVVGNADFSASDTDLVFLRLTMTDEEGRLLGQNTYWYNRKDYQDYRALCLLPPSDLCLLETGRTEFTDPKDGRIKTRITLEISNNEAPSIGVRIRLLSPDGADVLPVFWSDNYLIMMPGEKRTITAETDSIRLEKDSSFAIESWK